MTRSLMLGLAAGLALTLLTAATSAFTGTSVGAALPVILALAAIVAIMHHWKTQLFQTLRENKQQAARRFDLMSDQIAETQGLVQLTRFNEAYPMPFGGGWALTADAAVVLVRELALNQPRTIVELGSGVSTLLIGRMLKEAGAGKLYSLDHDAHWAELTRKNVRTSGLEQYVEVLDAPLAKQNFNGREFNWYQVPETLRQVRDINLIIVDGPPQSLDPSGTPRYPALPAFLDQLSAKAVIYIDDAKRPQELEMVAQWHKDFPGFESRMIDTVPGTCLFRKKS